MWGKRNSLSFETAVGGIERPSPQFTVRRDHRSPQSRKCDVTGVRPADLAVELMHFLYALSIVSFYFFKMRKFPSTHPLRSQDEPNISLFIVSQVYPLPGPNIPQKQ